MVGTLWLMSILRLLFVYKPAPPRHGGDFAIFWLEFSHWSGVLAWKWAQHIINFFYFSTLVCVLVCILFDKKYEKQYLFLQLSDTHANFEQKQS